MKEPTYVYGDGVFKIEDPLLGIEVSESYDVPELPLPIEEGEEGRIPPGFTGVAECVRHNRSLKSSMAYRDGVLHGPSYTYFEQGTVASERWYFRGLLHGRATDRSVSGQILCEKGYLEGKLHGPLVRRYPSGKILSTGSFKFGWSDGALKVLDEEGLLLRSTEFKEGRRHGIDEGWTDDGYFLFCEVWEAGEKKRSIVKDFLL